MHKHGVIDGGGEAGVSTPSWQPPLLDYAGFPSR